MCAVSELHSFLLWQAARSARKLDLSAVEQPADEKALKKLLRTRNNVLVLAYSSESAAAAERQVLSETALELRGLASVVFVDCG